ncbi:hypothetical protein [Deinococcus sp.]|uniref:hypothetical protein n=1 Tax=Deinococcus sp. TaxID=47478 RepID=UPI003CC67804
MTKEPDVNQSAADLEILRWPAGLGEDMPLPFMYWRVLHLADGRRSLAQIALTLQATETQLRQVVADAGRWLERLTVREQPMSGAVLDTVTQLLISVVGPMGRLMIDDALDELPEQPTLSALLSTLGQQLGTQHAQALLRQLRTQGLV